MCSCGAVAFLPRQAALAQSTNPEVDGLKSRLDSVQKRFAKLVQILDENVEAPVLKKVWENLGRDHAREYRPLTDKYRGNLEGFLNEIRGQWVEKAEYDAAKEAYSAVVGRPVEATLEESILRGGKKCVFRIQIL
jgi:Golgi nucleoside diphosphatase